MNTTTDTDPVVPRKAAAEMLGGIALRTVAAWEKTGRLPPAIRLSSRVIGWRRSTLEQVIADRKAAR